jgi:hypothetical protein
VGKKDKEKEKNGEGAGVPKADRSADTMFRTVLNNHFRLSQMADNKAHIMITICAGIIGFTLRQLFDPQLMYATAVLNMSCLIALFFAVYSTMPKLGIQQKPDPTDPGFNVIFFSNFVHMTYEDFEREMEVVIRDQRKIHQSMLKDLYSLGKVLDEKKYRFLRYCYQTFLAGLVLSAIVFVISWLSTPVQ